MTSERIQTNISENEIFHRQDTNKFEKHSKAP